MTTDELNELEIQRLIARKQREHIEAEHETDPTPWCSYGHRTQAECDCGPIANNE